MFSRKINSFFVLCIAVIDCAVAEISAGTCIAAPKVRVEDLPSVQGFEQIEQTSFLDVITDKNQPYVLYLNAECDFCRVIDLRDKRVSSVPSGTCGIDWCHGTSWNAYDINHLWSGINLSEARLLSDFFIIRIGTRVHEIDYSGKLLRSYDVRHETTADVTGIGLDEDSPVFQQLRASADTLVRGSSSDNAFAVISSTEDHFAEVSVRDMDGNELWSKPTGLTFKDCVGGASRENNVSWGGNMQLFRDVFYLHIKRGVLCASPNASNFYPYKICENPHICKLHTCSFSDGSRFFIRFIQIEKDSSKQWEILSCDTYGQKWNHSTLEVSCSNEFLSENSYCGEVIVPQYVHDKIFLLSAVTDQKYEYTVLNREGVICGTVVSESPIYVFYAEYSDELFFVKHIRPSELKNKIPYQVYYVNFSVFHSK